MVSSTCLFASGGGRWALQLAPVWGGGDGRGQEEVGGAGGQEAEQAAPLPWTLARPVVTDFPRRQCRQGLSSERSFSVFFG